MAQGSMRTRAPLCLASICPTSPLHPPLPPPSCLQAGGLEGRTTSQTRTSAPRWGDGDWCCLPCFALLPLRPGPPSPPLQQACPLPCLLLGWSMALQLPQQPPPPPPPLLSRCAAVCPAGEEAAAPGQPRHRSVPEGPALPRGLVSGLGAVPHCTAPMCRLCGSPACPRPTNHRPRLAPLPPSPPRSETLARLGYPDVAWVNGGLDSARPGEIDTPQGIDIR